MGERPIIFSAPMIRAILDGRKTQTRRKTRLQPFVDNDSICRMIAGTSVRIRPGDRLWVREAWRVRKACDACSPAQIADERLFNVVSIFYEADRDNCDAHGRLRSPIHMPRWASRLTLHVTDVRVQRLKEIGEEDAVAEGIPPSHPSIDRVSREFGYPDFPRSWFAQTWEHIHGPDAWDANPWVAAITFGAARPDERGPQDE